MTAQHLKNSILQMAVQGKLVPQDPNDEPASVLLERIRAEKESLIKAGKIKREKNPSVIFKGADNIPYEKVGNAEPVPVEVPFEIPESWEWVRIKEIALLNPRNYADDETISGFIPMPLISDGYGNSHNFELKKWKDIKSGYTHFANGDIVVAKITPCFQNRKSAIIAGLPNGVGAGTTELLVVRLYSENILPLYVLNLFKSAYFIDNGIKAFSGTAGQQRVGKEFIGDFLLPLPPVNEQIRIVKKIGEVLPLTDEYKAKETSLSFLNTAFPTQLKKSILQLAVQGKLVSQDENDEPASVLLERIREEKKALIKSGKLKKDKNESFIFVRDNVHYENVGGVERCIEDEIPFEIPESWEWVRLGEISTYANTKRKINASESDKSVWGLDLEDIEKGGRLICKKTVGERSTIGEKTIFKKGDILYSKLRPYLLKILIADQDGICTPEIVPFSLYGGIASNFIVYVLKTPYVDILINSATYGIKMPRVGTETMTGLLIPLPPVSEQHRLVEKIEQLLPLTNLT